MPEVPHLIYLFIPPPYELSTSYNMWISCGEINGDMFGGVEYNDDLYVLDVLSYG